MDPDEHLIEWTGERCVPGTDDHQELVLRLVRRLLAPGGVFLCSTPDVEIYTHDHGNDNPYHVRELDERAFRQLLGASFRHVSLLRQNIALGSLIFGAGKGSELYT